VRRRVLLWIAVAGLLLAPTAGAATDPAKVSVGAYINDVQQLDLQSHSYTVDMYVWFRWCDPDITPSQTLEFMNSFDLWGHILTYETEEPVKEADGCFYHLFRNQGKFNTKLPLADYPFDTQRLLVEFEDSANDASVVQFVPDQEPVANNPLMTLPGYEIGKPRLTVADFPYVTRFGLKGSGAFPAYSRVTIEIPVTRPAGTYSVKLLLPILIVLVSAALMFFVRPDYVEGRLGIGITALLTLVALQLTTNSALPDVNYLLMIDKIYVASYAFIVISLGLVARTSWIVGDGVRAVRFDRRSIMIVTVAYLGVLLAIAATQFS
jgi:hypothetical protein